MFTAAIRVRSYPQCIDIHVQHDLASFTTFEAPERSILATGCEKMLRQCHQGIGAGVFYQLVKVIWIFPLDDIRKRFRGNVFFLLALPLFQQSLPLLFLNRGNQRFDSLDQQGTHLR